MKESTDGQVGDKMHIATDADSIYTQRLVHHSLRLLSREPLNFLDLVRLVGGAYPTEVQRVLHSLVEAGEVQEFNGVYFLSRHIKKPQIDLKTEMVELTDSLKTEPVCVLSRSSNFTFADPHPADYDWRYTAATLAELRRRLCMIIEDKTKIALFGTPTLFPQLVERGANVGLFDRSQSLLGDLRAMGFKDGLIEHDLFEPIPNPKREYGAVVADPPWYSAFYQAFMLRSTELLQDEGLLFISVLPWLTRPSAIEDRAEILRFAIQAGFDLVEVAPNILAYETPRFERIALSLEGLNAGNWRAGDLFVFRRINEPRSGLAAVRPEDEPEWDEYRFGRRRVKLRRRSEGHSSRFSLRPIAEDGRTFGYVSRRAPFRSRIDLWTSDNLAYSVNGLGLLRRALKRLEGGESPRVIAEDLGFTDALSNEEIRTLENLLGELVDERE